MLGLISCGGQNIKVEDSTATPAVSQTKAKPATLKDNVHPAARQGTVKNQARQRKAPAQKTLADYKAKNPGWHVSLEDAIAESAKTGKPILANFTGSDWCGWCKRLDKSVFHQDGFKPWADKNVVLLELDFPRRFKLPQEVAQQNRNLAQSFQVRGYPTIWLFDAGLDASGKHKFTALGKTGYTKTLKEFQGTIAGYISTRSS